MSNHFALVLAGGGALGAYQGGFIKALSEYDINIAAISGASVGTLNGIAILGSRDIKEAAKKIEDVWLSITLNDIIQVKPSIRVLKTQFIEKAILELVDFEIFKKSPIKMWIAMYPSHSSIVDIIRLLSGTTRKSYLINIKNKNKEELIRYIISSCSLPVVTQSQVIRGLKFRDGGLGKGGNIPVSIIEKEGYEEILVSKLLRADRFKEEEHEGKVFLFEPKRKPKPSDALSRVNFFAMLNFSKKNLKLLFEKGYEESKEKFEKEGFERRKDFY